MSQLIRDQPQLLVIIKPSQSTWDLNPEAINWDISHLDLQLALLALLLLMLGLQDLLNLLLYLLALQLMLLVGLNLSNHNLDHELQNLTLVIKSKYKAKYDSA